jgi:hypothetical protein
MPNRDRKKLDLATVKKSKRKSEYKRPLVEEKQPVAEVEVAPQYEAPTLSEVDKIDDLVGSLKEEKQPEAKTKARPKLKLSGKKAAKKEEAKPDFLDMDKDGNTEEPMKKAVAEAKPKATKKKEVKEEVLETHEDRMLGVIDQQLSTMAKLTKADAPEPKSLTEQKIENLEGQVRDMRRMMLEMSSMPAQNTIVGGLGAGSPGSGEVNLLKLDDVGGSTFDKTSDGQLMLWDSASQKFVSSAERGVDNFFQEGIGGYEFTGGFSDREVGTTGASDFGTFVPYTQAMADAGQWRRFGFSEAQQQANDVAYWDPINQSRPGRTFDQSKGLFGGLYMPSGVTELIDYGWSDTVGGTLPNGDPFVGYSTEVNSGDPADFNYTAADGSFDFRECQPGDLLQLRFDFNVNVQIANTTLEIALIWQTRDANDNPTFTFALTGQPIFYGTGTVGRTFLNRPFLSAYFASAEDTNARALLAIRADNPIQVAPLSTLVTIQR